MQQEPVGVTVLLDCSRKQSALTLPNMHQSNSIEEFEKLVHNKFSVYNSLFLNLPYKQEGNIGNLIPILYRQCKEGLENEQAPLEILDSFFHGYANIFSEKDKIDFMFKVIQYVERQIVLYDSVEDAAFAKIQELEHDLSFKDYFQLIDNAASAKKLSERLSTFSARIVFTAHPTQFYSPSVLDIIDNLRTLIEQNQIDKINLKLQQLGLTSLINSKKPTPFEEAKNIIYFLRNVYYQAVGDLYGYIKENIGDDQFDNHHIIKLGFWPGGDRDGNPSVTHDTTRKVLRELQTNLMKCYYDDVKRLQKLLTFREVEDVLQNLKDQLYSATIKPSKTNIYQDILSQLNTVRSLVINNFFSIYLKDIDNLIDKVKIFKTHFASLDIRQDHRVHKQVVEAILIKEGIIVDHLDELEQADMVRILLNQQIHVNAADYDDEIIRDTILNISQLKAIQNQYGEEARNRYIISNSEDIFSVLFVYGLFRWCGWEASQLTFDIIPLFESVTGMDTAEATLKTLLELPEYRAHLRQRQNKQTIMLGFSDGTKDGGYMQANWSIFKTKERLSAVCAGHQVKAIFFDGRGGPPARGGGKTYRFYAAQTPFIANHEIQLTIQGQTITSKYGTKAQFIHHCEQLLTAGLFTNMLGKKNVIPADSERLMEALARISFEKYAALKNHPKFIPYLEQKSTLKYYNMANVGSRPGKRGNRRELNLTDLRAIPFVGSWSQLKQNIPGYYGIGTALKRLVDQGALAALQQLFREVPFFKALALNSMMSLSKCYFELTRYMQKDDEYRDFWNLLFEEYQLSKEMLLQISGFDRLMAEEPIPRESIKIREKIVLPLLVVQQYALQKISHKTRNKRVYEKIVTRSLYGNINASRNSA